MSFIGRAFLRSAAERPVQAPLVSSGAPASALSGGPSLTPGERTLLPAPPAGTPDPLAYLVDETLNDLQKAKKYCLSNLPLQRLIFLRRISTVARTFGVAATVTHLLPILKHLVTDKEDVIRQSVGIECGNLIFFLANPNKPAPKPPVVPIDEEIPWPDSFDTDESPCSVPTYVHAKPDKPTPLDRANSSSVSSPSNQSSTSSGSNGKATNSSSISSPSGTPASTPATSTTRSFFAKSKSLLALKSHSNSSPSEPAVAAPQPIAAPINQPSTSSQVSSNAASSTSSAESHSETSKIESSDANGSESSHSSASESSVSQSSQSELGVTVERSVSNSPVLSSTSTSSLSSPHAKLSTAHRAPASFDDPAFEAGYAEISATLIPIVQALLLDSNAEVRTAACDALVIAADVVREVDIGTVILICVLNLAHDERDDQRTTAVQLMHELAPKFGYDLCKSFVALELAAFADDAVFKVRKATAQCFGNVCSVVGSSFTVQKLLPCYVRLSKDLIWGVRKGCVDSLVAVARVVPAEVKRDVFVPIIERFIKDNSRWVRNGAFEILGPFLHTLGQELITRELLNWFTNIPQMSSAVVDAEVGYNCAFNFPAVLLALGPGRWEDLQGCFHSLVKDSKFTVRRTLACSLHEIAYILGPTLTQQQLLPVMDVYLRDVDEVRGGVIQSFARLLRCVPLNVRETYVEVLWAIQKQKDNWRWRYECAKQLIMFCHLFSNETTASTMIPFTFSLCRDPVFNVRITAARAVGALVKRLHLHDPQSMMAAIHACKAFANGHTYMERQLFVHMCESMLDLVAPELFIEEFLPVICALTADPIRNVRISLASFFAELQDSYTQYGAHRDDVVAMMNKLRDDVDIDVRQALLRHQQPVGDDQLNISIDALDEKSELLDGANAISPNDDSDREIDEILGHSAADREEEAAMHHPSSSSRARRLSHEQQVLELTAEMAADGVHEDRSENAILPPDMESELLAAAVDKQAQHQMQPIEQATLVGHDDDGQDVDLCDANEVQQAERADIDVDLVHSTMPRIDTPRVSFISSSIDAVPMDLDSVESADDPEVDVAPPKHGWMESDDDLNPQSSNGKDAEVLNDTSADMLTNAEEVMNGDESRKHDLGYEDADVEATDESSSITAS